MSSEVTCVLFPVALIFRFSKTYQNVQMERHKSEAH